MRISSLAATASLAALLSGCTSAPLQPRQQGLPRLPRAQADRVSAEMARVALDETARQVRRCYRSPRIASAGRQIITRLRIRLAPDGALGGLPEVIEQVGIHPGNQTYATRMAEAAIMSVIQCAPYRMPEGFAHGEAVEIELTFSPSASV
jgi:hypothetical protein